MALARSTVQPLRLLSRLATSLNAGPSRLRCPRCVVRCYSDQHPEVAPVEGEHDLTGSPSSSSSRKNKVTNTPKVSIGPISALLPDDVDSQPGLGALDELNPVTSTPKVRNNGTIISGKDIELWRKTTERIMASFTMRQLYQMSLDAEVPAKLFRAYNVRKGQRPTKKPLVKALMTHRFGMIDPDLEAVLLAAKAKSKQNAKSVELPITQIALLLLVLRGKSELQRLTQVHRVKMRPFRKEDEENVTLLFQGSEQSIEAVRDWVVTFCESIRSITSPLSSFSVSSNPVRPPSDHRLRLISQHSQTIVSVDDEGENITIYSVEDTSLNAAQSMLVQAIYDTRQYQSRHLYSYASPPIPSDRLVSVPTYGFVPYIAPTPVPWLIDPGTSASLFRITRQDIVGADDKVFSNAMQEDPDKPLLQSLEPVETHISITPPAIPKDDAFAQLRKQLQLPDNAPGSVSHSVEFGHLLFDNNSQAGSSRLMSLITPPLPGIWPLEHSLEWLRRSKENNDGLSSATPAFCSVIPPLATNLDAGLTPTSSSLSFGSDADALPAEKMKRRLQYWEETLQQFGFPVRSNAKHQLADIVDLNVSSYSDDLLITFAGDKADLAIQMRVEKGEDGQRMAFEGAQWVQKATADVLVPESCVDMRLSVAHNEQLTEEALAADEGLQRYLTEQKAVPAADSVHNLEVEERAAVLPQTAVVQGEKVFLVSARRVCRWEWSLFEDKATQYRGKLVMEKAVQDQARDNVSTFKIVVDEVPALDAGPSRQVKDSTDDAEKEGPEVDNISEERLDTDNVSRTEVVRRSVWGVMRPLAGFFLAKSYRSILR